MRQALDLARTMVGKTGSNPSVGCVIVNGDCVVGRGVTASGGRPHAETQALIQAGTAAKGATIYVTLEPCAHVGETPSCADAIIATKPARVVIAHRDPDPRTDGQGMARMQRAGVMVTYDVLSNDAAIVMVDFLKKFKD